MPTDRSRVELFRFVAPDVDSGATVDVRSDPPEHRAESVGPGSVPAWHFTVRLGEYQRKSGNKPLPRNGKNVEEFAPFKAVGFEPNAPHPPSRHTSKSTRSSLPTSICTPEQVLAVPVLFHFLFHFTFFTTGWPASEKNSWSGGRSRGKRCRGDAILHGRRTVVLGRRTSRRDKARMVAISNRQV